MVGLLDPKWGERMTAVVQLRAAGHTDPASLIAFVKEQLGSVEAPEQVEI